mmetsp:Transcript_36631/g.62903  ORF Transcript_36631/g.62903 Transcript_36631/m.62903 type:complete len:411 (+) Transcript_36631:55-1287(+)
MSFLASLSNQRIAFINSVFFVLFLCIGLTSWLLTNSLFVQVAYFSDHLPEGDAIASQLSLMIQASNIFPLLFVVFHKFIRVPDAIFIIILQILAILVSIGLSLGWDIVWNNHSIVLLLLTGLSGLVGCMSVVIFYPFAAQYSAFLTSAISLGMGFTGLVSSLLGIFQNIVSFSIVTFFLWNTVIILLSLLAFIIVLFLKYQGSLKPSSVAEISNEEKDFVCCEPEISINGDILYVDELDNTKKSINNISIFLMICQLVNCFIYYFLLGAIPYAVDDYENDSSLTSSMYIGGMILGSLGRFLCTFRFFRTSNIIFIISITILEYILGIYVGIQCIYHWVPSSYAWTIVLSFIIFSGINGYEDTLLYQVAAIVQTEDKNIERVTRFIGLSNQGGAFLGSIISVVFVELQWFT